MVLCFTVDLEVKVVYSALRFAFINLTNDMYRLLFNNNNNMKVKSQYYVHFAAFAALLTERVLKF